MDRVLAILALSGIQETIMTTISQPIESPRMGEPYLLTPGPLTTAFSVKEAMLKDWGSWDGDFRAMTKELRRRLLAMLGPGKEDFDCIPMQAVERFPLKQCLGRSFQRMVKP